MKQNKASRAVGTKQFLVLLNFVNAGNNDSDSSLPAVQIIGRDSFGAQDIEEDTSEVLID